jgi:RNA polymerase sigma factor (sigma-70 family)
MSDPIPLVHVVDDDDAARKAVTRFIKALGYQVQGYASAGEFLAAQPMKGPGCVILDLRMPGLTGLQLQESLQKQSCPLPIIFLSGYGDIPLSVRAIKAGAIDFLTKPVQRKPLLVAIEAALAQERKKRAAQERQAVLQKGFASLSGREREIFALVVKGLLNKQIAARLGISERTIKAHRAQVMNKMGVQSLAELVSLANHLPLDAG